MTVGKIINNYGQSQTPYLGGLVNHLPMGQLAIYKMTEEIEAVKGYTESFLEKNQVNQVRYIYSSIPSIEEALGNRDLYEPCLDLVRLESRGNNIDEYVSHILNKYILGISSGLFHTTIRMAYAIEGFRIDPLLKDEVERALAYYITAYREAKIFTRRIPASNIKKEMNKLVNDNHIKGILSKQDSLGQKLRALYEDKSFMTKGFIIYGDEEEKIESLLELLIPAYYNTGNIVALHCITGLHAVIVLKDYFDNYSKVLDILTTCIISHLLTIGQYNYIKEIKDFTYISWEAIISVVLEKTDVHAIKLSYTARELYNLYGLKGLKEIAIRRISGGGV